MTRDSGATTARVVRPSTSKRYTTTGICPRHSGRVRRRGAETQPRVSSFPDSDRLRAAGMPGLSSLLPLFRLLPFGQKSESSGLIQIVEQRLIDWHRARLVADQLGDAFNCRLAIDIGAQRIQV